jgi:hypothetical protein
MTQVKTARPPVDGLPTVPEDPAMLKRALVVLVKVALYLLVLVSDLIGGTIGVA